MVALPASDKCHHVYSTGELDFMDNHSEHRTDVPVRVSIRLRQ